MKFYRVSSTLKTVSAFLLAAIVFTSATSNANISCGELFSKQAKFEVKASGKIKIAPELGELFIDAGASQRNSTTGNRTEFKRTVKVADLKKALQTLAEKFELKPRDAIKPGTKNVTVTYYLNVLKFDYKGQELGVKIRFRKYGTIAQGLPNTIENVQINPDMKDVSFVEFKIDHPDFENSVLKPRGLQNDSDLAMIGTPEYLKNFDQILKRAVQKNSKSADSIEVITKIQNVLKRLHEEGVPLEKDSRTIYERTSYALPLTDPQTKKSYEIQITMDEGILLYSYPHKVDVDAYKSEEPLTVVELKIPVEMVDRVNKGFRQDMVVSMNDLKAVDLFLANLTNAQAPGYLQNSGKQSFIRSILESKSAAEKPSVTP